MSLASQLKMKGFKLDLPDTEYHSGPGLSSSNIKQIMRSPSHLRAGTQLQQYQADNA
jgi:thiamine pyrophosphokinase